VAGKDQDARSPGKAPLFYGLVAAVGVLDLITKILVQRTLSLYEQRDVLGSFLRLTYIYNPGAAFGINLGPYSRWIFLALSVVVLAALFGMFAFTPGKDRLRIGAIGLVCGGALGNLVDRIKSESGVVDFLDVGFGTVRWPVFNVADMALTVGAIILALSLWREEKRLVSKPERN
jgi:signal peptidase II